MQRLPALLCSVYMAAAACKDACDIQAEGVGGASSQHMAKLGCKRKHTIERRHGVVLQ
jgi:hypothetical protein